MAIKKKRTKSNVCILTSAHQVFDTRIFYKQAKTLANVGYKVTLIAPHEKNVTFNSVEIIGVSKPKNRIWRTLRTIKLFILALKQKAEIYHFHDPELLPTGVLLKFFTHGKVIYDVHEHYPNSILGKYWIPIFLRKIIKELFELHELIFVRFIDYVIYTTPIVGERYQRMKIKTQRIENTPLLDMFKNTRKSHNKDNDQYLIYIGMINEKRGIIEVIEAFSLILEKYAELKLYLIGSVTPEAFKIKTKSLIIKLGIDKNVRLISPLPYDKIKKYLINAILGLVTYLPYPNNKSCLPNKLFEYMACGLPVIASDFPLYRQIIEEVNFGRVVNPENPKEIAGAIDGMLSNPIILKKMSTNARKGFVNKYNWSFEAQKLINVYKSLMNSKH